MKIAIASACALFASACGVTTGAIPPGLLTCTDYQRPAKGSLKTQADAAVAADTLEAAYFECRDNLNAVAKLVR